MSRFSTRRDLLPALRLGVVLALALACLSARPLQAEPSGKYAELARLASDLKFQLNLTYRLDAHILRRHEGHAWYAVEAWRRSRRTSDDDRALAVWLREATRRSLPWNREPLPTVPRFVRQPVPASTPQTVVRPKPNLTPQTVVRLRPDLTPQTVARREPDQRPHVAPEPLRLARDSEPGPIEAWSDLLANSPAPPDEAWEVVAPFAVSALTLRLPPEPIRPNVVHQPDWSRQAGRPTDAVGAAPVLPPPIAASHPGPFSMGPGADAFAVGKTNYQVAARLTVGSGMLGLLPTASLPSLERAAAVPRQTLRPGPGVSRQAVDNCLACVDLSELRAQIAGYHLGLRYIEAKLVTSRDHKAQVLVRLARELKRLTRQHGVLTMYCCALSEEQQAIIDSLQNPEGTLAMLADRAETRRKALQRSGGSPEDQEQQVLTDLVEQLNQLQTVLEQDPTVSAPDGDG